MDWSTTLYRWQSNVTTGKIEKVKGESIKETLCACQELLSYISLPPFNTLHALYHQVHQKKCCSREYIALCREVNGKTYNDMAQVLDESSYQIPAVIVRKWTWACIYRVKISGSRAFECRASSYPAFSQIEQKWSTNGTIYSMNEQWATIGCGTHGGYMGTPITFPETCGCRL